MAHFLSRIAALEPRVHAWAHLAEDKARAEADRLDDQAISGPLHGLPVGVKDLFDTCDMPTGYGSDIYRGHRPPSDAAVVALIRRSGGIVPGKTVTTEFAFFTPGKTRNPHDLGRTPGGSSSGSAAAVAAGMVPLALGTQTAGSIIRPASYCGIVGYKPSVGLISPAGLKMASWSLDTVGVFARTVPDAALLGSVLTGRTLPGTSSGLLRPPRIGICRTPQWSEAEESTRAAIGEARRRLLDAGASVSDVDLPAPFDGLLGAQHVIMVHEAARSLAFERDRHADLISDRLLELIDEGGRTPVERYDEAQHLARICRKRLGRVFANVDVLLTPSAVGEAPVLAEGTGNPVFNRIWTLLGTPCVNLPGLSGPGRLPVGVQVIGPLRHDERTLSWAQWIASRIDPDGPVFPGAASPLR